MAEKPEQSIADQYDPEAAPATEAPAPEAPTLESAASPEPATSEARSSPAKDPETGRFVAAPPADSQQHSSRLVTWAKELGLTDGDLLDIPVDHLEHVLHTVNRQALARAREGSVERAVMGTPVQPESAPEEPMDWGQSPEGEALTEKDFNPTIVRMFKELKRDNRELRQAIQNLNQREAVRVNETISQKCDRFFLKYPQVFGQGTVEEIDPKGRDMRFRKMLLDEVADDKSNAPLEQKLNRAARKLFPKAVGVAPTPPAAPAAPAPKPMNGAPAQGRFSEEEWEAAALARPTARTVDPEPPGVAKAERSVAAILRQRGEAPPSELESGSATTEDFI